MYIIARDIVMANLSVSPSVCPSHSGSVLKWMHMSSNSLRHDMAYLCWKCR